jgi:hypothetical protein
MLYVVLFGYGRRVHIVMHILEKKYGGYEHFEGGFKKDSR